MHGARSAEEEPADPARWSPQSKDAEPTTAIDTEGPDEGPERQALQVYQRYALTR